MEGDRKFESRGDYEKVLRRKSFEEFVVVD